MVYSYFIKFFFNVTLDFFYVRVTVLGNKFRVCQAIKFIKSVIISLWLWRSTRIIYYWYFSSSNLISSMIMIWHRCFPLNFVKFLRTPFFTEHLRWLLLYYWQKMNFQGCWNQPFSGDRQTNIFKLKSPQQVLARHV